MGDFKKNPKKPFEVAIPNKIRKRIAMHETDASFCRRMEPTWLRKILALHPAPVVQKKGSMWSRFTGGVKKYLSKKFYT